ncbi:MAG TPA: hypothetical protein VJ697_10835 [Nitrososphaeraceae archaeon]|nr:hypothetical protein [Nitrososphaeraceae archaeon]
MKFEEKDFDKIIIEKVIPFINKEKENFIIRELKNNRCIFIEILNITSVYHLLADNEW